MSDNEKWVWSSDDEPIPALFRPEPSTSKTDIGLHLDLMPAGAAKSPAASASLGKALALHLVLDFIPRPAGVLRCGRVAVSIRRRVVAIVIRAGRVVRAGAMLGAPTLVFLIIEQRVAAASNRWRL